MPDPYTGQSTTPVQAAYPPPNVQPASPPGYLNSTSATPAEVSRGIIGVESGGKNIVSPQGARGPGQIMPATFRQYALPGENIDNPADNMRVHNRIIADYMQRYHGDPARVAVAYFSGPGNVAPPGSPTPWIHNVGDVNIKVSDYVARTVGKMGGGGAPSQTASPASAPQPQQPNFAQALKAGDVGSMLAALNAQDQQGKTPLDPLEKAAPPQQQPQGGGGGGGESAPPLPTPPPPGAMAMPSQQLLSQVIASSQRPLSWGRAPFGAGAGPQQPMGTTLNTGNFYG